MLLETGGNVKEKSYAGNGRPFVYAQFVQEDRASASEVLAAMREHGFELWPSESDDKRRMKKSALALFFLSPTAAKSEALNSAIARAVQTNHPMLVVYLAPTELTPAQRLLLNTQQAVERNNSGSDEAFFEKLFGSGVLQNLQVTSAQKRAARLTTWGIAVGVLAAAALTVVLALGVRTEVPENSLLAELGFSGSMSDITNIYVYGDAITQVRNDQVIISVIYDSEHDTTRKSVVYNNLSNEAAYGTIVDISDFVQLKNLKELSIAGNHVEDISALYRLNKLEYLDLSGNPVSDISGIGKMSQLKTLCIGGTLITDISALDGCKRLEQLYVDPDQYRLFEAEENMHSFTITPVGPLQELANLSCDIFGGPDEGCLFGIWIRPVSGNVYEDYSYELLKNGRTIPITGRSYDDDIMDKVHLLVNEAVMDRYDPNATYTLIVTYESYSATYQIWYYLDYSVPYSRYGQLIETTGFSNP